MSELQTHDPVDAKLNGVHVNDQAPTAEQEREREVAHQTEISLRLAQIEAGKRWIDYFKRVG